jgi:hypothetical protein
VRGFATTIFHLSACLLLWRSGLDKAATVDKPFWEVFRGVEESNAVVTFHANQSMILQLVVNGNVGELRIRKVHTITMLMEISKCDCTSFINGMLSAENGICDW